MRYLIAALFIIAAAVGIYGVIGVTSGMVLSDTANTKREIIIIGALAVAITFIVAAASVV